MSTLTMNNQTIGFTPLSGNMRELSHKERGTVAAGHPVAIAAAVVLGLAAVFIIAVAVGFAYEHYFG